MSYIKETDLLFGYRNKTNLRDYSLFSSEYFTGCDVTLYFGNIWVDEINAITFSVQENILPIFGYNSYTFDALATGNRIVTGSFRVNFTESKYIYSIAEKLANQQIPLFIKSNISREQVVVEKQKFNINKRMVSFDEYCDYQESLYWKDKNKILKQGNSNIYANKGFDILIVYGDRTVSSKSIHNLYFKKDSSIIILKDVHIYSVQRVADTSDNPLMEEYQFVARDIL